jgi:tRNA A58 N-methylase Trm61
MAQLVPWLMSASPEKVSINKGTVVAYLPTVEEIAKVFTEATSSIQLVK